MSKKTVAELLVETLAVAGVERMYGVAGDSLNGITDAIRRHEQLRWLPVRHEAAAVQDGFLSAEEFDRLVDLQEMVGNPHRDLGAEIS